VLGASPGVADRRGALELKAARGQVRMEGVSFGYIPGQPVLRDVSLEAAPGETVAIVGLIGAGKSTLINLIPRFFDPWEGRVLIDGNDARDVQLRTLRAQVALGLQAPLLCCCAVVESIACGRSRVRR